MTTPSISSPSRYWQGLSWIVRLLLAILLLSSLYAHFQNPYRFYASILDYRLLPVPIAAIWAAVVPWFQLTFAVSILGVPKLRRAAAALSAVLFVTFLIAQVSVLVRGMEISCGCFGDDESRVGWKSISLSSLGLVLSIGCALYREATESKL